jgi:transketolase
VFRERLLPSLGTFDLSLPSFSLSLFPSFLPCLSYSHLKLGNLIAIYGSTSIAFTEDVAKRFESYDWQVLVVEKGDDDLKAISDAIEEAKKETSKPTIIKLKTTIGFGSKDQGTHGVHGNPLKADDTVNIKKQFGFNPEEIYSEIRTRGQQAEDAWTKLYSEYSQKYPGEAEDINRRIEGRLPDGWEKALPSFQPSDDAVASRKLSEVLLAKLSTVIPELVSGSADLTPSNLTRWKAAVDFQPKENGLGDYSGRYIVRPCSSPFSPPSY